MSRAFRDAVSQGSADRNVRPTQGPSLCFPSFPQQASRAKHDASVGTPHVAVAPGDQTPCPSIPGLSITPGPEDDPGLHRLEIRGARPDPVPGAWLRDQEQQRGVCRGAQLAGTRHILSPDRGSGPWGSDGWARRLAPMPRTGRAP